MSLGSIENGGVAFNRNLEARVPTLRTTSVLLEGTLTGHTPKSMSSGKLSAAMVPGAEMGTTNFSRSVEHTSSSILKDDYQTCTRDALASAHRHAQRRQHHHRTRAFVLHTRPLTWSETRVLRWCRRRRAVAPRARKSAAHAIARAARAGGAPMYRRRK